MHKVNGKGLYNHYTIPPFRDMATILKAKQNGDSKDSPKEKNTSTNNAERGNHSKEKTYEEKLAEIQERRKQNNKKFLSWKDRKQAFLFFVDPDHGNFDRVPSTLDPGEEVWPMRDICDQRVREITYHNGEEVLGTEQVWRMPITAVEAFERFRKRKKHKLEVEKTGEGGQIRYLFYEIERDPYPAESGE
jgi:hypothetical protein